MIFYSSFDLHSFLDQPLKEPMVLWGGLSLNTVVYVTLWCM